MLCGADELGHGVKHAAASGDAGGGHIPDQCPEGGDNCVCRGAVQANGARANAPDAIVAGPLFSLAPPRHLTPPVAHHLTADGSPTGLASWGESLTIRAYLQNFRF